jgi:hypothetical protein
MPYSSLIIGKRGLSEYIDDLLSNRDLADSTELSTRMRLLKTSMKTRSPCFSAKSAYLNQGCDRGISSRFPSKGRGRGPGIFVELPRLDLRLHHRLIERATTTKVTALSNESI